MSRSLISLALFAAILLGAACRGTESDPVPAGLPGSYVYAASGSTLKKPWRFAARLELRPDKSYTFVLDKTVGGEKDRTDTTVGTYGVSGDYLLIHDSDDPNGSAKNLHKLRMRGDSLIAEVGWTAEIFLKSVGAPNVVFVKERRP